MADYQKMYYILCRAMDKALDVLPGEGEAARQILQQALYEAEEKYIDTAEDFSLPPGFDGKRQTR